MKSQAAIVNDKIIAKDVQLANSFLKRLVGLLGHSKLNDGEALVLEGTNQIHTFNMKFPIDVLFIGNSGEILYSLENMQKNKVSPYIKNCKKVLELGAGTIAKYGIKQSDIIKFS